MSPITHLFASWIVAAKTTDNLRDRRLVALSGLLPDVDGAGLLVDYARQALDRGDDFYFYQRYHHSLLHGVFGAVLIGLVLMCVARRPGRVFLLAVAVAHLHFLCDLVGSRGPTPLDIWPIHYLAPFSYEWTWRWSHQWALDAWPNRLIGVGLFAGCLFLAVRLGDSVVGVFNRRADAVFVQVIRRWWERGLGRSA
jgi:hypothetical protein